jgi:HEAT repeat protein
MAARDPIYKNRELAQQAGLKIRRRIAPEPEKRGLLRAEVTEYLLDQARPSAERRRVKNALIHLGGEALIPLLDQALEKTNDTKIHLAIVEILVTLTPDKPLQNVLIRCLHHPAHPVRRLAMAALGDIGDREAIYFLGQVAHEGRQRNQILNLEDAQLANEAIKKIERRTGNRSEPISIDEGSN